MTPPRRTLPTPGRRSVPGRRAGLAATAVLALALTACGGGDDSATPEASEAPGASSSASASSSATASASASGETSAAEQEYVEAVMAAAEEEDVSVRSRVTSTIDSPEGEIVSTVEGITQLQDGSLRARFDTTLPDASGGEQISTVIVDSTLYVQAPGIPDGKYQQIDVATAGGQLGAQLQQQLDQIDPRAQAAATIDSIQSVEKLGEETVRGVEVTRYRVTQDFEAFARSQQNELFTQLVESGQAPRTLTSTVSLDADDRVRRSVVELEVQGSTIETVADFLEYDVDADITAPPQRQVVESPVQGAPDDN